MKSGLWYKGYVIEARSYQQQDGGFSAELWDRRTWCVRRESGSIRGIFVPGVDKVLTALEVDGLW